MAPSSRPLVGRFIHYECRSLGNGVKIAAHATVDWFSDRVVQTYRRRRQT